MSRVFGDGSWTSRRLCAIESLSSHNRSVASHVPLNGLPRVGWRVGRGNFANPGKEPKTFPGPFLRGVLRRDAMAHWHDMPWSMRMKRGARLWNGRRHHLTTSTGVTREQRLTLRAGQWQLLRAEMRGT